MAALHPLIHVYRDAGQGHVFEYFDTLTEAEQRQLLLEASEIDLEELKVLSETLVLQKKALDTNSFEQLKPAPFESLPQKGGSAKLWALAREVGEDALKAGRVAAFTVAGGQGTRLGFDGPKGTFEVTAIKKKSLFQVFAEKIKAAAKDYGKVIHWFIMTSQQNDKQTISFFQEHDYFGLDFERVHFFKQGRMPAVNFEGKILLESKSSIALSPDGHGGSLRALERSGALNFMQKNGIDTLSYFQVDNPLVRCIDPVFIGWHLLRKSEMSSKMVPKAYAEEKVGHFCIQNDKLCVVEYSDLPMEFQKQRSEAGELKYIAGSIAIHILDREFIRKMAKADKGALAVLPFHRADKKITCLDCSGNIVTPTKPNGVKFELFVFDALPFAANPVVIETERSEDFSPVKNAEGVDSPKTCKEDQMRQAARWLKELGETLQVDSAGLPLVNIEISPLFGYDFFSFKKRWSKLKPKPSFSKDLYLT